MSPTKDKTDKKRMNGDVQDSGKAIKKARKSKTSDSSLLATKGKPKAENKGSVGNSTLTADKAILRAPNPQSVLDVGPVLVSAMDFNPPQDASFRLHHQASTASTSSVSMEDGMILAGETESMDIVGWNWDLNGSVGTDAASRREAKGYSGEYVIGLFDPKERTVTLRQAPLFTLRRSIKSLNSLSIGGQQAFTDWQERVRARRGLGEAFGNRKTKAKARNEDRMKVDTSNMADIMGTLQSNIDTTMADVPNQDSITEEADLARPIPTPNLRAVLPSEAYPLDILIPDGVYRMLQTKGLESVNGVDELSKYLPAQAAHAPWIKERMWDKIQSCKLRKDTSKKKIDFGDDDGEALSKASSGILKSSKEDSKSKVKIMMYISLLWGFVKTVGGSRDKGGDKEILLGKLRLNQLNGGEFILDDLFTRFGQMQRGAKRAQMTSFTETKLYAYMFALCLHFEDFSIEPAPLARDLGLSATRVSEIFKSLGCTTANKNIFLSDGTSQIQRRIVLKCPFELPQPRRGRRN